MNHHSVALRLPVELLCMVFDSLKLQDLLTASHVSTFWRAVAVHHPRLDAGGHKSVTLRVLLAELRFPVRHLPSAIIPAIRHNIFRMDSLILDIDIAYESEIFAALRHPAPRLHTLDFALVHGGRLSDAMQPDLFACQAPNLRDVRIGNIMLHADQIPDAFSSVTAFGYCSSEAVLFPATVFAHCKSLKELDIFVKVLSLAPTDDQGSLIDTKGLQSLDVSVLFGGFDFVQRIACGSIPKITIGINDHPSVHLLLRHLQGRLEVRMYHTDTVLYLQYQSLDTGMTRRFLCRLDLIARPYLPPVYVNELASRVQTLHSSATVTGLIPAFRALTSCTRVALTLADREQLQPPIRVVSIPELQEVEISSASPACLSADDLAVFLDAAFAPVCRVVRLVLKGVVLDGDPAAIPIARFSIQAKVRGSP